MNRLDELPLSDTEELTIKADRDAEILLMEIPIN
jgi:hypothetical protein